MLEVKCSDDYSVIKNLFTEYSQIKGAEGCVANTAVKVIQEASLIL
ncbi:hypothetical protein SAMN04487831_10817 [Pseudobutyrivibrio sp. UC1225]|nr:hypothetical protein [Pseudobutyrivibrio sp. UC1225]SFO09413.1 hypothetical protein SAMN04487831_10817 [Pseudobutyrivibrio sp. UC1225]